jgi:hypothetical protein
MEIHGHNQATVKGGFFTGLLRLPRQFFFCH